jgi:phosphoserine phosphatase
MNGKIDFKDFKQRMALLEGLAKRYCSVWRKLPLTKERIVDEALKYYGYKTAILGGFTFFGKYLQKELGIDYVHANELKL